jgi:hypothetical protein
VRNERLLHGGWPVLHRLADAGIEVILLKGAALLAAGYGDLGLRYMADIDILVPTAERSRAIALLGACGFRPEGGLSPDAVDTLMPPTTPGYGFRNDGGQAIDLHWNALHQSRQPDADADFWAASRPMTFRDLPVRVLDPADRLLHALAHGLRWNQVPPLRWVLDAALILTGDDAPDMRRLVEQARRRRLAVPVRRGLDYLRRRFAMPVPDDALRALARSGSQLQRWEADLEERDPAARSPGQAALHAYLAELRGRVPLGRRPGWRANLGALVGWRGLDCARQLPADLLLARPWWPSAVQDATELAEGVRLAATRDAGFHRVVSRGWQVPESNGTWTGRREGLLRLKPTDRSGLPVALAFAGAAFVAERHPEQSLELLVNGRRLARWRLSQGAAALPVARVPLPGADPQLELRFRTGPLASPRQAGFGADPRRLGFFLEWLEIEPVPLLRRGEPVSPREPGGDADRFLAGGWQVRDEEGGRIGPSSRLLFRREDAGRATLRLLGMTELPESEGGGRLSLLVDGRLRARWALPAGRTPLQQTIALPSATGQRIPVHRIELRAEVPPLGSAWLRELSIE